MNAYDKHIMFANICIRMKSGCKNLLNNHNKERETKRVNFTGQLLQHL